MNMLTVTSNDGVATVVISNPPANILTIDVINEINALVLSLKDDRDTKVVIFKSSNELFFLAHLDLNVINGTPEGRPHALSSVT